MGPQAETIEQVKAKHEMRLMQVEGVEGVGIGEEDERAVIKVYVSLKTEQVKQQVPDELEGYPIRIEVTGEFNALPAALP